jgi:hypothetical protein
MRSKKRAWPAASMRLWPQIAAVRKRVMPARLARRRRRQLPTMLRIRVAVALSERVIIGRNRSMSALRSGRLRTLGWFR